ncbi:SUN domain-containing protein 2-like isoform X3 [Mugil cephalus]|uniref:SUN domain-containing protein 2-like isoform X3 n=1 Tax=Mugil cephalus TaxID=48193 RepID=UPI001FB61D34|nr:SUN domain-containing protein 2-like isoform X3 [Mugil cephalus]
MSDDDVYLQSWGWTHLSSCSSTPWDSEKEHPSSSSSSSSSIQTMSRRSLRLDDGLLDRSLPTTSASFSVGGGSWRTSRSLMSRRSQHHSVSCSESLLQTPRKAAVQSGDDGSVHSDASLISSLLDQSSIQETTLVDTLWGLDQDLDPKESTVIEEQSRTLVGPEIHCNKHSVRPRRVYCKDCELHTDQKEPITSSSSKYASSSTSLSLSKDPETSIYSRDRSRKGRTDVLQRWLDSCARRLRRAAASSASALGHAWQVCQGSKVNVEADGRHGVRSGRCGVMSLKEAPTNGSLSQKTAETFMQLWRRWRHTTSDVHLHRFPLRLLLVLLPLLLLLFSLLWFGPAGLLSVLPGAGVTERRTSVSDVPGLSSVHSQSTKEETKEVQRHEESLHSRSPPETSTGDEVNEVDEVNEDSSERLLRLEQSLRTLWELVEDGGRRAELRHQEVMQLYTGLQQRRLSSGQRGDEDGDGWLNVLLDQQLSQLRGQLDEERRHRDQVRQEDLLQQQSQTSRLDQIELQLQKLSSKTQEMSSGSTSTLPAAVSAGVDRPSHDALLAEVARLEAALEDVREDVRGLSQCRDDCQQLARIQQMVSGEVSSRVREEVRSLVYGNQLAAGGGDGVPVPESVLQWLSERYVSEDGLKVALASLELRILQNISLQLEQRRNQETVGEDVLLPTEDTEDTEDTKHAVTREDVHVMVSNALRLFSEDRTGLADYALESGGGSILSTRCSETYETKAALLSLFGLPLWYFSQSPRVVIQPDVHPGNCWAFRGATGFLVIRLSMRILPSAFTLEHISKALAPSGTLRSAPRDFSVYGLKDENQDKGKLLGTYTYDEDGDALQTYAVTEQNDESFQIIEVQVLSNWGHQEYTCIYRFRVHGTPSPD